MDGWRNASFFQISSLPICAGRPIYLICCCCCGNINPDSSSSSSSAVVSLARDCLMGDVPTRLPVTQQLTTKSRLCIAYTWRPCSSLSVFVTGVRSFVLFFLLLFPPTSFSHAPLPSYSSSSSRHFQKPHIASSSGISGPCWSPCQVGQTPLEPEDLHYYSREEEEEEGWQLPISSPVYYYFPLHFFFISFDFVLLFRVGWKVTRGCNDTWNRSSKDGTQRLRLCEFPFDQQVEPNKRVPRESLGRNNTKRSAQHGHFGHRCKKNKTL